MNDEQYKNKIVKFYRTFRRMPSFSEIARIVGYSSKSSVHKLVGRLENESFFARDASGKLVPNRIYGEVKVLGYVEAGFPSAAEEEILDTMSFDDYLIENKEATYILKVKGESMIDAGIREGDMVVAERTDSPKEGEIVIADVDGGWTMKYLRKDKKGQTYLEPANKKFKNIYPENDLKIAAVVKAVIRKY